MKLLMKAFFGVTLVFAVFSYGFIDPNLTLLPYPWFDRLTAPLTALVYGQREIAAVIYATIVLMLFALYYAVVARAGHSEPKRLPGLLPWIVIILLFSYPALSYDIYNYVMTAKVTYLYRENPYVIQPVEIPSEPGLAYTRAANKTALYGPVWIMLTALPHVASLGNIALGIVAFKGFVFVFYAAFLMLVYRKTRRMDQVLLFALHPLVLLEVIGSGHNDMVMVTLSYAGLLLWRRKPVAFKAAGLVLFAASVLIKGASIVLLPLFLLPRRPLAETMRIAFWLSFAVFFVSPLREEMYPWYAVWWLAPAAFIPIRPKTVIHAVGFWFGMGLMLRYVPWIATREYGGITPAVRIILMLVPLAAYGLLKLIRRRRRRTALFL